MEPQVLLAWSAPLVALAAFAVWRGGWRTLASFAVGAITFAALLALNGTTAGVAGGIVDSALRSGVYDPAVSRGVARAIVALALVAMSVVDARTRRVPREFSWAWLAAGIVASATRFVQVQDLSAVAYWVGFYALWQAGILGGGDAKLLMGAFGLWPDPTLLWFVAGVTLVRGLAWVIWRYRGQAVARLAHVTAELATAGAGFAPPGGTPRESAGSTTPQGGTPPIRATFAATWAYALAVGLYLIVATLQR